MGSCNVPYRMIQREKEMKRSSAIVLIVMLAAAPCPFSRARAEFGVMGGLTVSNWWGEDTSGEEMKAAFLGGVTLRHMFSDVFGFQTEILFHRKGTKDEYLGVELTWDLDYLEIPMLFKWVIPTGNVVSPGVIFGPALAFNIDSTLKGEYDGDTAEEDVSDIISDIDLGVVLGLNIGFDTGSAVIVLDLRYTLGFMTIDDSGDAAVRNGAITFMAGVAFPLGLEE
jgi:hypothetical protein